MSYSIYPLNSHSLNLPVTVLGIGSEDNQPHVLRREGFPVPQIFLCLKGEGTLKSNENSYMLTEGSFFCLLPNTPHEYYGNTEKWEVNWIAFSGNQIDQLLTELKFDNTKVCVLKNTNYILTLFKKIFAALKTDDDTGKMVSSAILYEILVKLHTSLNENTNDKLLKDNKIFDTLKLYIDEHYNQAISLEELSVLANITPQYLCKLFKRHLNLRPFQYIALKRIQQAKKMLADSTLNVNDIAQYVGYNDCSYFCAVFKKYELISPTEFRGRYN